MAYIGRDTDKISNIEKLDVITFDGSSSYTLQKNSINFTPNSANSLQVSIDGVVQAGNFTVSGSTIDFGVAIPSTSTCDFIFHYGTGLITTPADGTVGLAQLSATGTKDATTFLRGDNTFSTLPAGGITEADQWRITVNSADSTGEDITSNWERSDSTAYGVLGTGMTESSGIFTFPSTGIYLVTVQAVAQARNGNMNQGEVYLKATTDNSTYSIVSQGENQCLQNNTASITFCGLIDVTNTSNVKVKITTLVSGGTDMRLLGTSTQTRTGITFVRLGDT